MKERLRIVFAGARAIGGGVLSHLRDRGCDVQAVLTVPGEENIARAATGLRVFEGRDLSEAALPGALCPGTPDLMVVVSYPRIIPPILFGLPRWGAINFHGALLPRYRGRAPINWAIIHGETETGLTVHRVSEKVDAGPILLQRRVSIGPNDTAGQIVERLHPHYLALLDEALELIPSGRARWIEQDESKATWFPKRGPEDGALDWNRPAEALHNWVRALTRPYPGAFTALRGRRLYVWSSRPYPGPGTAEPGTMVSEDRVAARSGTLRLLEAEWEGGGVPDLRTGERLGS